jgi:hypothetical protein
MWNTPAYRGWMFTVLFTAALACGRQESAQPTTTPTLMASSAPTPPPMVPSVASTAPIDDAANVQALAAANARAIAADNAESGGGLESDFGDPSHLSLGSHISLGSSADGGGAGAGTGGLGARALVSIRTVKTVVVGRLSPEIVQRIVRHHDGRFQACYLNGLNRNPAIAGTIAVDLVIGTDGATKAASLQSTMFPDVLVAQCVRRVFYSLQYPRPESGEVTVVYALRFTPPAVASPMPSSPSVQSPPSARTTTTIH